MGLAPSPRSGARMLFEISRGAAQPGEAGPLLSRRAPGQTGEGAASVMGRAGSSAGDRGNFLSDSIPGALHEGGAETLEPEDAVRQAHGLVAKGRPERGRMFLGLGQRSDEHLENQ